MKFDVKNVNFKRIWRLNVKLDWTKCWEYAMQSILTYKLSNTTTVRLNITDDGQTRRGLINFGI